MKFLVVFDGDFWRAILALWVLVAATGWAILYGASKLDSDISDPNQKLKGTRPD
jgi:hypothetical protein